MYENKKTLKDVDIDNKKVIVRLDFNVPIKDGVIVDTKRINAAIPTIQYLLDHNASIILLSHLGRIKTYDDIVSQKKSLLPIAKKIQEIFKNYNIKFIESLDFDEIKRNVDNLKNKEILLLQNTRYYDVNDNNEIIKWESKNNDKLAKFWASLADVFVNDAFGTAHRSHASNAGIAKYINESCIGFLMEKELYSISKAIDNPRHPYIAILGGAKISDKLKVINNLINKCDKVIICGGMAYTFLAAQGYDIGTSICENEMLDTAKKILVRGKDKIILTCDCICNEEFIDTPGKQIDIENGLGNLQGLDIGSKTISLFNNALNNAKTVVWNGPCGVCEFKNYQNGTYSIANTLKNLTKNNCYTLIGGGDSASAIINLGFNENDFSFISTGGGASLALIEGSPLIGIEEIKTR